jgi:glycosyltransferase involved in cell wall biosynthesis
MTDTLMPVVSICIQTYQHSAFIKDCLEGVLSQKTDYPYEILLGEDDSTDGTREICVDYAKKYPEKIRLFLHDRKNVIYINGKPTGRYNFINNLSQVTGRYIALCDGDDYWTDRNKLQKQVEFLEKNNDYAICFHAVELLVDGNLVADDRTKVPQDPSSIIDLARGNYIHTSSCVYRNNLPDILPDFFYTIPAADYALHILMAQYGKIKYIPDKMAVYRIHEGARWSSMSMQQQLNGWLDVLQALEFYFINNGELAGTIRKQRFRILVDHLKHYKHIGNVINCKEVALKMVTLEPLLSAEYIFNLYQQLDETIEQKDQIIKQKNHNMARVINHPISGVVINILKFLKRDESFGKLDD